jgi:hypothetical protein
MKKLGIIAATLVTLLLQPFAQGQEKGNYTLTVNGQRIDITLGQPVTHTTPSGEKIQLMVERKDIVSFDDEFVSFQHKSEYNVSKSKIEKDIYQLLLSSALGTGFLIQEYATLNPAPMNEILLQEVIKEDLNYGYKLDKQPFSIMSKNGKKLEGVKATLTYQTEEKYYIVVSYGEKDRGMIIMTMLDKKNQNEKALLDLLWNSLVVK